MATRRPLTPVALAALAAVAALLCCSHAGVAHAQNAVWTPLRAYVHAPALLEDDGASCFAADGSASSFIKVGRPAGCGAGCQHIDAVTGVTSQYIYEGTPSSGRLVGAPAPEVQGTDGSDVDIVAHLPHAWTTANPNDGVESFTFEVAEATLVTGVDIHQTWNGGALSMVEGYDVNAARWVAMWSRGDPALTAIDASVFRIRANWTAPEVGVTSVGRVTAKQFRVTLDTSLVLGYSLIDAVAVYGHTANGMAMTEFTPPCAAAGATDCWYACQSHDIATETRYAANANVVRSALGWLMTSLNVRSLTTADGSVPPYEKVEADGVCAGVPTEAAIAAAAAVGADAAFVLTQRPALGGTPYQGPVSASVCARYTQAAAQGRPAVVHLNVVPTFATAAGIDRTTTLEGFLADEAHRGAVDAVVHFLYRAMGWGYEHRTRFLGYGGVDVTNETTSTGTTWAQRGRITLHTPKIVAAAEAHFGASGLGAHGVELEDLDAMGSRGAALESRIFNGEVMALPPYVNRASFDFAGGWAFPATGVTPLARSAVSLALLEDTGWYYPNYFAAEHLDWGYKEGAEFAINYCATWQSSAQYLCAFDADPQLYTSTALAIFQQPQQCTPERKHKGTCVSELYSSPLPTHMRFFTSGGPNYGGVSEQHDYCPFVVPEASGSFQDATLTQDCRGADQTPTVFFEEFGQASRCFDVRYTSTVTSFVSCLVHKCTPSGSLQIKVREEVKTCPPEGGEIKFDASNIFVHCPTDGNLCETYASAVAPSLVVASPVNTTDVKTFESEMQLLLNNFQTNHVLEVSIGGGGGGGGGEEESTLHMRMTYYELAAIAAANPSEALVSVLPFGVLPVAGSQTLFSFVIKEAEGATETALASVVNTYTVSNDHEQWAYGVVASSAQGISNDA